MAASTIPSAIDLATKGGHARSGSYVAQGNVSNGRAILNGPGAVLGYDHNSGELTIAWPQGSASLVGRAAATHINKWFDGLGVTIKAHQFREEHRGPVLLVQGHKSWQKATQYYLDEVRPPGSMTFNRGTYVASKALQAAAVQAAAQRGSGRPTMPPTQAQAPFGGPFPTPTIEVEVIDSVDRIVTKPGATKAPPPIPPGFVQVRGRIGQPLILPIRVVQTFESALKARRRDKPIHPLAIGPTGTGKTEGLAALGLKHGMNLLPIVACGGIETATDWFGQTRPDAKSQTGWTFHESTLWRNLDTAVKNPGMEYLLVLDEVNRVLTGNAQNTLFSLMDGSAELQDPATGHVIALPKNVFLVATANIGAAYGATQTLDSAFRSRFATNLVFDYLPEVVEGIVLSNTGIKYDDAVILARAAAELRSSGRSQPFRSHLLPGTREMIAVAELAKDDPEGIAGAWDSAITASFSAEGNNPGQTERARVRTIAETVFKSKVTS